jgi:hypothetical protein
MEIADEDALRAKLETWTDDQIILRGQALRRKQADWSITAEEFAELALLRDEWRRRMGRPTAG